mgnify:CR=1 FL=1
MEFTAKDVNELRKQTGAGMMACKKALQETDGDMEKAAEYLNIPSKSTLSLPTIRFVISPKIFGRNNSPATYSAEVISDRIKTKRYL